MSSHQAFSHKFQVLFAQNLLFAPSMFFGKATILLLYFEVFHVKKA